MNILKIFKLFKNQQSRLAPFLLAPLFIFFLNTLSSSPKKPKSADLLWTQAKQEEKSSNYIKAKESYGLAEEKYRAEKNQKKAVLAQYQKYRMEGIMAEFPYTEDAVKELLKKTFENISKETLDGWIQNDKLDYIYSDGQKWYFAAAQKNVNFRNPVIRKQNKEFQKVIKEFIDVSMEFVENPLSKEDSPFSNPEKIKGKETIQLKRKELPEKGIFQVWIPVPINTPEQQILSLEISPKEYVKSLPKEDSDLGVVYMEIPLDTLKNNLKIVVQFSYLSFEQNFSIDPKKVKPYNTKSSLYKIFTSSSDDIQISDAIKKRALAIVGKETNPLKKARLIYDYVVKNIAYSLTPHASFFFRKISEADQVDQLHYGDCGAQSIYFSALCRAVGVPARLVGGYQLLRPGTHFWAQFYLEGYGWIPVDPSVGSFAQYLEGISAKDYQKHLNYYFGHLDSKRMIIQTDINLIPENLPLDLYPYMTLVVQYPLCYIDQDPNQMNFLIRDRFSIKFKKHFFDPLFRLF